MGRGKWKNWVTLQLGAEFTLGACTAPNQLGGGVQPQTKKPMGSQDEEPALAG